MAAVIGTNYKEIQEILATNFQDIDIANINTPSQIVISGKLDSLEKAADYFEDEGLVYIPLKVSGGFHSRYMSPIKLEFKEYIETLELKHCNTPVISNYSGVLYSDEKQAIINNMVNQIDNPIKWLQSIEYLLNKNNCDFIELGAGEVLSNLIKKIRL